MNNKLLRSGSVYEPHILSKNDLPFIFHKDFYIGEDHCNLHENIELLYFMKGNAEVRCGNQIYDVQEGDCIIVNSYQVHQVISDGNIHFSCLIIDNSFCQANDIDIHTLLFTPLVHDELLNKYYNDIRNEYINHNVFERTGIKCAVLTLLLYLCRNHSEFRERHTSMDAKIFDYVRLSTEYIREHLADKIILDDIASYVGLSKYHLSREFKKMTGYSLMQYMNTVRCEQAQKLLSTGKYKIKEVALQCGFDNYSYFANIYKTYMGVLPSEQKNQTITISK